MAFFIILKVIFSDSYGWYLPGGGCTRPRNPPQLNLSLEDTRCENFPQTVTAHFPVFVMRIKAPANI